MLRYEVGSVTATIITPTFVIGGRRMFLPNPLRPDRCDLVLSTRGSIKLSFIDRYLIRRAASFYLTHQLVAVGAFVILFGLTPLLATRMNLFQACLFSVGITYWLCAFHWLEMWRHRRLLGIDAATIRADMLHVLLCPPNAANCARRVAALRNCRFGVMPCLRSFSRLEAEMYEEQFTPLSPPPADH